MVMMMAPGGTLEMAKAVLDDAFKALSRRPEIWDTLRLGAQFDDAGIGSDEMVFRRLYPFSPALVATLVALSQALQRERTALKTMLCGPCSAAMLRSLAAVRSSASSQVMRCQPGSGSPLGRVRLRG